MISDERDITVCQLTLNEIEMTAGECMSLQVYAKQYGVHSEKNAYTVCYDGKTLRNVRLCKVHYCMPFKPLNHHRFVKYYFMDITV